MPHNIRTSSSPALRWLVEMLNFFSIDAIMIPKTYREQVLQTKKSLTNDTSGLVNTVLDFSIEAASVDYTIETNDQTLSNILNQWLDEINIGLLGKIPTGIGPLSKEYFRERWKGSSNLVLMTRWTEINGWQLPTSMWFIDGEDILVKENKDTTNRIGDEQYRMIVQVKPTIKSIPIAGAKDERFFVQKPFEAWSTTEPIPYLIRKGLLRNMLFYDLLAGKGEHIVQKAVEYMMLMRKGNERLAAMGSEEFIYSEKELIEEKDNFAKFLAQSRLANARHTPTYTTQFDTEFEHLIPEYERALKQSLYTAVERRLLAGLGMIDIVEGTATNRKESLLNPKPLENEVLSGVKDFKQLIHDVVKTIIRVNRASHPRKTRIKSQVYSTSVSAFLGDKDKAILRSVYDRGGLSKQTFTDLCGNTDFEVEVNRRKDEQEKGLNETMYPHVIQNQEGIPNEGEEVPDDRTGPEGTNFNQALEMVHCAYCEEEVPFISETETMECPVCLGEIEHDGAAHPVRRKKRKRKKRKKVKGIYQGAEEIVDEDMIYEEAPFKTNKDLPKGVKVLPGAAQTIWRKTFNNALNTNDELSAIRIAWSVVKQTYKKVSGKWVKREQATHDPVTAKKLEVLEKQGKVYDNLLGESANENL